MGLIVLIIFICCGYYAQTRGKVRHESLSRMITDHSNLFSPINCLNYGFSKVENTPYLSPKEFPDLQIFEDNWEVIKEEAMTLYDNSQITASAKLNDVGFNSFLKPDGNVFTSNGMKPRFLPLRNCALKQSA